MLKKALFCAFLGVLGGCLHKTVYKDPLITFKTGKCWQWDSIQRRRYTVNPCAANVMVNGRWLFCSRKAGHFGYHHHHYLSDCRYLWKGKGEYK